MHQVLLNLPDSVSVVLFQSIWHASETAYAITLIDLNLIVSVMSTGWSQTECELTSQAWKTQKFNEKKCIKINFQLGVNICFPELHVCNVLLHIVERFGPSKMLSQVKVGLLASWDVVLPLELVLIVLNGR